jgi:biotin synthase-related radical SAM superfamily protein
MLKDGKGETPEQRAARKWRNKELSERFKKAKETGEGEEQFLSFNGKKPHINAQVPKPPRDPEIAEALVNVGRKSGTITRFENRFKKEIRTMMEGHVRRNVEFYYAALQHRRYKLLKEKLRRLKAAQEQQPLDLFGG